MTTNHGNSSEQYVSEPSKMPDTVGELERIRDEVLPKRRRIFALDQRNARLDKQALVEIMIGSAREGGDGVPVRELVNKLQNDFGYEHPSGADAAEAAVRKALTDLNEAAQSWYSAHPEVTTRIQISSNGRFELQSVEPSDPIELPRDVALRKIMRNLVWARRFIVPRSNEYSGSTLLTPTPDVAPLPHAPAEVRWLWTLFDGHLLNSLDLPDWRLLCNTVYELTSDALRDAIESFHGTSLIAIEHHPTHDVGEWTRQLAWLDKAYHTFLNQGSEKRSIIRIVHFTPEGIRQVVKNDAEWERWCVHVWTRIETDHVRVVLGELPAYWRDALDHDVLIIPKRLVVRFEEDDFPRHFVGHSPNVGLGKNIDRAVDAILKSPSDLLFEINPDDDLSKRFLELRQRLEQSQ